MTCFLTSQRILCIFTLRDGEDSVVWTLNLRDKFFLCFVFYQFNEHPGLISSGKLFIVLFRRQPVIGCKGACNFDCNASLVGRFCCPIHNGLELPFNIFCSCYIYQIVVMLKLVCE